MAPARSGLWSESVMATPFPAPEPASCGSATAAPFETERYRLTRSQPARAQLLSARDGSTTKRLPLPRRSRWRVKTIFSSHDLLAYSEFQLAQADLVIEQGFEILLSHIGTRALRLEDGKQRRGSFLVCRQ